MPDGKYLFHQAILCKHFFSFDYSADSLETESDIVKKKEEVNIDFDVKSSKDYIYVEKVVVNGKEYNATRKLTRSLFSKSDKYSTLYKLLK